MMNRIKNAFNSLTLAAKIRYSYLLIFIPMLILIFVYFYNIADMNRSYEAMVKSAASASDFSLDFKKDFDYETYLLIVGNKEIEESELSNLLSSANKVVDELCTVTSSSDNLSRLKSAKKYLVNLETYKGRIEENLKEGNKYEDNIEIWENDIQIVTSLLRETIFQYIYYEISEIEAARVEYQTFYNRMVAISVIVSALFLLVLTILSFVIPRTITKPITEISQVTDQVAKGDLTVRAANYPGGEVSQLSNSLNAMIEKINDLISQVKGEQEHLRKAELELLQSQINPHFLYNTLDTILWLAEGEDQKMVVSMVESLSDFFRTSLNQGKDIIVIGEELVHVGSYLKIQQVRYQDILEYEIDVPEILHSFYIPKITIQPLVENALYHGIKNRRRKGNIKITGELLENDRFVISVIDNGIGMDEERLRQVRAKIDHLSANDNDIYGLYNVNERIRLKFGDEYGLSIDSVYEQGTRVDIILPCYQTGSTQENSSQGDEM